MFLAVGVATTWWAPMWSEGDTMPRAIDFYEMTRNSFCHHCWCDSWCDSIRFFPGSMHFSICPIALYSSGGLKMTHNTIGLYRDVWIAAIASSRTSLATLLGVMCNTSQWKLRSLRVNSGMGNVIWIVTQYTRPPNESFASLSCNGVFAIKAYGPQSSIV